LLLLLLQLVLKSQLAVAVPAVGQPSAETGQALDVQEHLGICQLTA
jgi:hypothetical protein